MKEGAIIGAVVLGVAAIAATGLGVNIYQMYKVYKQAQAAAEGNPAAPQ